MVHSCEEKRNAAEDTGAQRKKKATHGRVNMRLGTKRMWANSFYIAFGDNWNGVVSFYSWCGVKYGKRWLKRNKAFAESLFVIQSGGMKKTTLYWLFKAEPENNAQMHYKGCILRVSGHLSRFSEIMNDMEKNAIFFKGMNIWDIIQNSKNQWFVVEKFALPTNSWSFSNNLSWGNEAEFSSIIIPLNRKPALTQF